MDADALALLPFTYIIMIELLSLKNVVYCTMCIDNQLQQSNNKNYIVCNI